MHQEKQLVPSLNLIQRSLLFLELVLDISCLCFHINLKVPFFPIGGKTTKFFPIEGMGYRSEKGEKNHWIRKWGMSFQPVKCNMMQLTRKHLNKIQASYTLEGAVLENVDNIKYLGVTITDDLKWNITGISRTKKLGFGRMFFLRAESRTQGFFPVRRPKIMLHYHTCDKILMTMWEILISFQGD